MKRSLSYSISGLCLLAVPHIAFAQFANVQQYRLTPVSDTITFDEYPVGAYGYLPYVVSGGPLAGTEIVFGSYFQGQTPQGVDPVSIPEPSAPGQPLQLLYDINNYIQITADAASPTSPVLAGGPITFAQPVSILFTKPVFAIGLTAGYLDAAGSLVIAAYDANGNELGTVTNGQTAFEQFGLIDSGSVGISGLTIDGTDPAGFGIDNVFLSMAVPEPASIGTLLAGLAGLILGRRRRS